MRYVAVFFAAMVLLSSLAPHAAAQIRINEILADPASDWDGDGALDAKNDEWVELINTGSAPVDLSQYRISDASAGTAWRFVPSGVLAPGEIRVVYGSSVVAWQQANGVGAYGLSLNNGGDTVTLYRVGATDTVVADEWTYGSAETRDDRSVGRSPDGSASWVVFDALNPYTGSVLPASGCYPSPGLPVQCALPTKETSWGALKSMYRG